jgi:aminotransferase
MGCWSFDAMKILVCGDGGFIYCRNLEHARRFRRRVYLGLETESGLKSSRTDRWWEFEISEFGRRAIMNDIAAAIARVQLRRLPEFFRRRAEVDRMYREGLGDLPWLRLPPCAQSPDTSSYYFFWIQTAPGHRDRLAAFLRERGIYTTFRYYPLHRVRAYHAEGTYPGADYAAERTLLLPMHHSLSDADVDRILKAVREYGASASPPPV